MVKKILIILNFSLLTINNKCNISNPDASYLSENCSFCSTEQSCSMQQNLPEPASESLHDNIQKSSCNNYQQSNSQYTTPQNELFNHFKCCDYSRCSENEIMHMEGTDKLFHFITYIHDVESHEVKLSLLKKSLPIISAYGMDTEIGKLIADTLLNQLSMDERLEILKTGKLNDNLTKSERLKIIAQTFITAKVLVGVMRTALKYQLYRKDEPITVLRRIEMTKLHMNAVLTLENEHINKKDIIDTYMGAQSISKQVYDEMLEMTQLSPWNKFLMNGSIMLTRVDYYNQEKYEYIIKYL